jgi:serine/threonine protein kinase
MSVDRQHRLFDACLDAATDDERERLLESCPDAGLREQVRSLLRAHAQAPDSVYSMLAEPDFPRIAAPHQIGPYRILERLGEGAMGEVFLAEQQAPVRRRVALKIIKFGLASREVIARFELERQTLALLSHQNIARIFEAGTTEDGRPYFVMEYVPGIPITRYCDERCLDIPARLALYAQVCAAVQHAHLRGVIHRDLKPSNILVAEIDGTPTPKVIDFGIAKATTATAGAEVYTRFGHLLGTPEYMSPEQAQLSPLEIDTRTDVYSLGVVLYQLLTGERPYVLTSDAINPAVVLSEIATREARRPSDVAAERTTESAARAEQRGLTPAPLATLLRGDLDWIVLKAIEKDRQRRYDSPAALADDLQRHANDEPVLAGPPSTSYRMGKFVRRHRVAVATLGAAAATLVAISAVAVWQMVEANRQREVAEQEAVRAESAQHFLYSLLSDTGMSGRPFTTLELLGQAEKMIDAQYGSREDPLAIERLLQIAQMYASLGQHTKSLELVEAAYRGAAKAGRAEMRREAACTLGRQWYLTGRLEDGSALLDGTIEDLRGQAGEAATLVSCLQARSDVDLSRGDIASGLAAGREAVALSTEAFRTAPLAQISPRMQLAIALRVAGERKLADDAYQDLARLFKRLGRDHSIDAIVLFGNWSKLKSDVGDMLGAARLLESALRVGQALRPDGNADHVLSMNYAQTSLILHQLDPAEHYFSLIRRLAAQENDAEYELISLLGLSAVARERGDIDAARARLETASEFARTRLSPEHRAQRLLLLETGQLHLASNSFAAAAASLSEVVAQDASVKARMPRHVLALTAWAQAELGRGDAVRAASLAKQGSAFAAELALPGAQSYWIGRCLLLQSEIEVASGHMEAAGRLAAQSLAQLEPTVGSDHPLTRKASAFAARTSN